MTYLEVDKTSGKVGSFAAFCMKTNMKTSYIFHLNAYICRLICQNHVVEEKVWDGSEKVEFKIITSQVIYFLHNRLLGQKNKTRVQQREMRLKA